MNRFWTLVLILLAVAPAEGQTRSREILSTTWNGASFHIAAYAPHVLISSAQVIDRVILFRPPGEIRLWLEGIQALRAKPFRPLPGETLEDQASSGGSDGQLVLTRTARGTSETYTLALYDEHFVNGISIPMPPARIEVLVSRLRQAADASDQLTEAAGGPLSRFIEPPEGTTWIGDLTTKAAYPLNCFRGTQFLELARSARMAVMYFPGREAISGFNPIDQGCPAATPSPGTP